MQFDKPIIAAPERIVDIAENEREGSGKGTLEYLKGLEKGYAIPIQSFLEMTPISLKELREKFQFTVPQSYMYLHQKPDLLSFLQDHLDR